MTVHHSTRHVPRHERLAYWEDMICATYAQLQSRTRGQEEEEVYGAVSAIDLGLLQVSAVQTTISEVARTAHLIAKDDGAYLLVHLARAGTAQVEHRSRSVSLAPGDMTAYITCEPYRLTFNGWSDTQVIKLPLESVCSLVPDVEDLVGLRIHAPTPELEILRTMLRSVWQHRAGLHHGSTLAIAEALRQSVAAVLGTLRRPDDIGPSRLEQFYLRGAKAFIEERLRGETPTVGEVAAHLGISARHLARLFAAHAVPLHRYTMEAKLRGCASELLRLSGTRGAIHTVAYDWGFSSPGQFSRAFKSQWGRSPSDWLKTRLDEP